MGALKDKGLKPVYYIYGPDEYLIEEEILEIRSRALCPGFESMNLHVFNCKETRAHEVVAAASTLPAFTGRRVVVLKGADALKAGDEAAFMAYVEDPAPLTCLVLAAYTDRPERGSAFLRLLSEKGYCMEIGRPAGAQLIGWIKGEARRHGKAMTDGAARRLSETAGTRLRDLRSEIEKLAAFVGGKDAIEAGDVADAGLDLREETAFKLTDAIGSRDVKEALRILDKVSGEEPVKVLGAIAWRVRTLLKARTNTAHSKSGEKGWGYGRRGAASAVGAPPARDEDNVGKGGRFTVGELVRAIVMLRDADAALKTGRTPVHLVLPRLVIDLCSRDALTPPEARTAKRP
jgi:DNA polymerase-3 subunit delta